MRKLRMLSGMVSSDNDLLSKKVACGNMCLSLDPLVSYQIVVLLGSVEIRISRITGNAKPRDSDRSRQVCPFAFQISLRWELSNIVANSNLECSRPEAPSRS